MKISTIVNRGIFNDRLVIKEFKRDQDGHRFLNKQTDNKYKEYTGPLSPGSYAFVAGEWKNIKSLPSGVLAHV